MRSSVDRLLIFAGLWLALRPFSAQAQATPPSDSIIAQIRARMTDCDSAWREVAYLSTTHERELDSDGKVEKETVYKSRVYVRHDDQREIIVAMWDNGQPVSDKKLREENADREKQRRKQAKERQKKQEDEEEKGSFSMMDPFHDRHRDDYDFAPITPDTLAGLPVWKINVQPRQESEDLFRGTAWVTTDTYRAVAEEYQLAKLPSGVKGMDMRFDYGEVIPPCAFPRHFLMRAHGRALLVIKFNMEVDVQMDSVQVDPALPDSLFAIPED
jgi:hypothetical protein